MKDNIHFIYPKRNTQKEILQRVDELDQISPRTFISVRIEVFLYLILPRFERKNLNNFTKMNILMNSCVFVCDEPFYVQCEIKRT